MNGLTREQIKQGDRVKLKSAIIAQDMFPAKYTDPVMRSFEIGETGTVESLYPSGAGIVRFDGGKGLFVNSIAERFLLAVMDG